MNPGNQTVCFSTKRKTSAQVSLSKRIQLWNATCKGLFWSLILSASMVFMPWSCWNSHCNLYMCVHACSLLCWETQNPPKGTMTSVWRLRALPFNNTCCSSERHDGDHYTLHSHDPFLPCLMSWNVSFSLSWVSADSFKQISKHIINKMTIYRAEQSRTNYDISVFAAPKM